MKYRSAPIMVAASLFLAYPAVAVPPPPPQAETLDAVQAVITAMTKKDFTGYASVLADGFVAQKAEDNKELSRAAWLEEMKRAFQSKAFGVTIVHVYEGSATVDGQLRPQVMLVERVSNFGLRDGIPSDCCAYYLTETITLEGGKIKRIERSTLYNNELSKLGERTDLGRP